MALRHHINDAIGRLAENHPMLKEGIGEALSLIPFVILIILLYLTGREKILAHRESA